MKGYLLKILCGLFFLTVAIRGQSDTSLIISEVMFYPESGNNEFVELYNLSPVNSIDLNNYQIKYYSSSPDVITAVSEGTLLPPRSFAIILEGDYDFSSGIYNQIIPPEALVLKISDNAFGSNGMSNSSDRPVSLLNPNDDTLDAVIYSANNPVAISDEKIYQNHDSSSSNWTNSLFINGTPGFRNSVTPYNYDLKLDSLFISPVIIFEGDDAEITAEAKNIGENSAANFSIKIYNDVNFDSIGNQSELIYSQNYFNLQPGDSVAVTTILNSLIEGDYQIIAKVDYPDDEDTLNNKAVKSFLVLPPGSEYNDVVINEIMYAPLPGEPEWVELYNRSNNAINLNNWKLADNSSTVTITNNDVIVDPDSFIVLSKDSSIYNYFTVPSKVLVLNIPTLNNSGDAVVVKDSFNVLLDSVLYFPEWGGRNGKSLERILPELNSLDSLSWGTSISRFNGTPGYINSVTPKDFDMELSDIVFDPQFPIAGDDILISLKVKNKGSNSANYSIELFEDTNLDSIPDNLLTSINNQFINAHDSALVNTGYTIYNIQNKKGFYSKIILDNDQDTLNNFLYKSIDTGFPPHSVVINELMYNPSGGEPEWIEVYNTTSAEINLKNWEISDLITTPTVVAINSDVLVEPHSYFILTKNSSIINYHRYISSGFLEIGLPVLNNDADGVIIKDERGQTIDSVYYNSNWGGLNGKSLERKQFAAGSNLPGNWGSSVDVEFSTPGRINSITPKHFDLSVSGISFTPRFPVPGEDVAINAKIKNNGSALANNFRVQFIIDTDSNQVVDSLIDLQNGISLESGDSVSITSNKKIKNITSKILTGVKVEFPNDEDTLNNYYEKSIEPGFQMKSVLINEVMYDPDNGEPEWIEFVNNSDNTINLKYWSVSDLLISPTKNYISEADLFIEPNEYFIVTRDTSFKNFHPDVFSKIIAADFGTLGNSKDGIILYDFRDGIIDSLKYNSEWGGKNGRSLERISIEIETIDSSNWATSLSTNKSTPGIENSVSSIEDFKRNDLVINEIMYEPEPDNSEFIEFYNNSSNPVNVGGWRIEDESGNNFKLSDTSIIIPKGKYFLLSADSMVSSKYSIENNRYKNILNVSSLGFSNTGEIIQLKDIKNNLIDSVSYSKSWHNKNFGITKNISLERINPALDSNDPSNWSSCVNPIGATPLSQNSIFTNNVNREAKISLSPNPFSPDNDGFEDFTIINYNLTQPTSQIRIKIFDSHGRLVRNLENNRPSGSKGSVIFNGFDDSGRALRIGIYIVYLEALNENSGINESLKTVVVVARKL